MILPESLNRTALQDLGQGALVELQVLSVGTDMQAKVREDLRLF